MTGFAKWLSERPQITIDRLTRINNASNSSAHILLSLSYGLHDPHIRALNKMIVGLLLARHRAQRSSNDFMEKRIESKLQELHEAMDMVTGCRDRALTAGVEASSACKRAVQVRRAS